MSRCTHEASSPCFCSFLYQPHGYIVTGPDPLSLKVCGITFKEILVMKWTHTIRIPALYVYSLLTMRMLHLIAYSAATWTQQSSSNFSSNANRHHLFVLSIQTQTPSPSTQAHIHAADRLVMLVDILDIFLFVSS